MFVSVDYDKKSYLAGETLTAKVKVKRPDAEPLLAGSNIAIKYQLPGQKAQVKNAGTKLSRQGEATFKLEIPKSVEDQFTFSLAVYEGYND